MKVDVVIVTFRSADRIEACLRAVPVGGTRVIVVDNASGDESPVRARAAGATVVVNRDNRGFAAAANQGARMGAGEAILFLNPDAVLGPGALEAMLGELERNPRAAVVGASLRNADGSPQRSRWPYPSPRAMWTEAFALDRFGRRNAADGFVVGACFLVRRSVFEQLAGFDERFWLYGEEADLCRRAEVSGWRVALCESAVVDHEGGASGCESSEFVAEQFARGSDRFVLHHRGRRALVSYRLAGLTASLLRWPILRMAGGTVDDRVAVRTRQICRTTRALLTHPTTVEGPIRVTPVGERPPELVVVSLEAWDNVWRRNQFLVRELLQLEPTLRVLFVEPPHDVLHAGLRARRIPPLDSTRLRTVEGEPRVMLMRPRKWLPRSVWPGVDASLARQVRRAALAAGFARPYLWVNDATYANLVVRTEWPATYDITDDWLDAAQAQRRRERLAANEATILRAADHVVVCSPELQRRKTVGGRLPHLVPNAVDVTFFRTPQQRPRDLPTGKTAVYVGTLHDDRIDLRLVQMLANWLPDVSFVFVGPNCLSEQSMSKLADKPNVYFLGPRPYSAIPAYLQHAEVIVVPHRVSPFTESLDPIKAYECVAVGTPTLATPVAGFRELGGPIHCAEASAFPAVLARMLAEREPTMPAPVPTWGDRAAEFWAILTGEAEQRSGDGQPIDVVYVGHTALDSGGELALVRLLPGMPDVKAHVVLGADGPLVSMLEKAGASVEVLPMADGARMVKRAAMVPGRLPLSAMRESAAYTWQLSRRLRELHPDVVHTNTLKAALYGGVAGRLAGVPVVWHIRDRIADDYLPPISVRVIRQLARVLPSAIITTSAATRSTLGATDRVTAVAPSPVVHDPVTVTTAKLLSDGATFVVGIVGRIAPWKGQDVFLRAFARAFPAGDARAVVVGGALFGEDDFAAELRELAASLGIADRVEFTGHVTDAVERMHTMHVVVHASVIPEPFGQVVVEAMAAGRPVIASAAGGPLEIVTNEVDGLLVPPGNVAALAAAMARLRDDPALRRRLGDTAQASVGRFRPEKVGAEVMRVYRRVGAA